jgi:hypothetical protein
MAKINRFNGNVKAIAADSLTGERYVFGSDVTVSDELTDQYNAAMLRGWGIIGASDFPPLGWFNAQAFTATQFISYLHQMGIPEWNALQEYQIGGLATRTGVIYKCLTADHISATVPESDATNWKLTDANDVAYNNTSTGLTAVNVQAAIDELFVLASNTANIQYLGTPVGGTIALPTNLAGIVAPPKDNANFRYILLTAGESGTGEYNETILTSETVVGSAPLLVATAVINLAASPINGLTVNLLNSEGRFVKPGTSSGTVANDQMQQITGSFACSLAGTNNVNNDGGSGAITTAAINRAADVNVNSGKGLDTLSFDSANSSNARTGTFTDVKNIQHTYYMRIA